MSKSRRKFLVTITSAVAGFGALLAVSPFVRSLKIPKYRHSQRPYVDINLSKIKKGETKIVEFKGKPFFVTRRKEQQIDELSHKNPSLRDPNSEQSHQPEYAINNLRSLRPEFFVGIGLCTHLGCMPNHTTNDQMYFRDISSGYFCPCHGAKYDLAGRVFSGGPAPFNLEIPEYAYIEDDVVRISSW